MSLRIISMVVVVTGLACSPATTIAPPAVPPHELSEAPAPVVGQSIVKRLAIPAERDAARRDLESLGDEAWGVIQAHSAHPSPQVRWELANVAGVLEERRAEPLLIDYALGDESHHVRWRSLWALSRITTIDELDALLIQALDSEDQERRWNAAIVLSFFDSAAGVEVLHENTRNPDPFRRWEAINALGRAHNDDTVATLRPLLESPSVRDRQETVMSLGLIGTAETRRLLVEALGDPAPEVRWRAILGLQRGEISGEARQMLERIAESDADEQVRQEAIRALETGAPDDAAGEGERPSM